jgi:hypothetical protein
MAKVTCFVCKRSMQNYTELAQHILSSTDIKHKTKAQVSWASRFINKLPAKDTYSVAGVKPYRQARQAASDAEYWNSRCSLCHKLLKDCCC